MTMWRIEPRDPLVVRDGRPNSGRSESATLAFPYPSTVAGMVRTRLGTEDGRGFVLGGHLGELLEVGIRGPLLVEDNDTIFVPAPRDFVALGADATRRILPLRPSSAPANVLSDDETGLETVEPVEPFHDKPTSAPAWWLWDHFAQWLAEPRAVIGRAGEVLDAGLSALESETRTHVKLGKSSTAEDGMLFATSGLRFAARDRSRRGHHARSLGLLVDVTEPRVIGGGERRLRGGVAPGGGERRLLNWSEASALRWPTVPEPVARRIDEDVPRVRVRVVLLTPACFSDGWRPAADGFLLAPRAGLKPRLVAAVVPRPETISGWDLARQAPKATRRLVSAGSVYWVELDGEPAARRRWIEEIWMNNISDDAQDRRDGFGLVVVGVAP